MPGMVNLGPWGCCGLPAGRSVAAPPPLQRHKSWTASGLPAPQSPPLTLSLGPLALWRSQHGQIPVGWSSLLHGQCPPVSPLDPQITADLLSNGIDVYPQKEFDEDSEDRLVNEKFRVSAPTRLLFPEAPHFPLEDVGGGLSRGPGKQVGWS